MSYCILLPIDFSSVTERQLDAAKLFSKSSETELTLIHVVTPSNLLNPGRKQRAQEQIKEARTQMDRIVRGLGADLKGLNSKVKGLVVEGDVLKKLQEEIENQKPQILILGAHSHVGSFDFLFGSVAQQVVSKCTVPILAVPPEGPSLESVEQVTVGVDYSAEASELIDIADQFAVQLGARLYAAHSSAAAELFQTGMYSSDLANESYDSVISSAQSFLEELVEKQAPKLRAWAMNSEVLTGHPTEALLDYCEENGPGVLVLGTRSHSPIYRATLGSFAGRIVREAKVPILLVPFRNHKSTQQPMAAFNPGRL